MQALVSRIYISSGRFREGTQSSINKLNKDSEMEKYKMWFWLCLIEGTGEEWMGENLGTVCGKIY